MFRNPYPILCGVSILLGICYLGHVDCYNDGGTLVKIYVGKNFQGRQREIFVENNKCFPLFGDWAVTTQSIKFDAGTCIQLYEGADCDGSSKMLRGRFQNERVDGADLERVGFARRVQSVHLC